VDSELLPRLPLLREGVVFRWKSYWRAAVARDTLQDSQPIHKTGPSRRLRCEAFADLRLLQDDASWCDSEFSRSFLPDGHVSFNLQDLTAKLQHPPAEWDASILELLEYLSTEKSPGHKDDWQSLFKECGITGFRRNFFSDTAVTSASCLQYLLHCKDPQSYKVPHEFVDAAALFVGTYVSFSPCLFLFRCETHWLGISILLPLFSVFL